MTSATRRPSEVPIDATTGAVAAGGASVVMAGAAVGATVVMVGAGVGATVVIVRAGVGATVVMVGAGLGATVVMVGAGVVGGLVGEALCSAASLDFASACLFSCHLPFAGRASAL